MNQMTSPALALAINNFNPDWLVRPARTKRSASLILDCSSAALGSASMILAVSRVSNLPHGNPTIAGATAASTCIAESRLRCRVAWATFRARHAATWPAQMSCHSSGSRWRRSNASAIECASLIWPHLEALVLARCGPTLDQPFPSTFGSSARAITRGRRVLKERSRVEQFEGIRRDSRDRGHVDPGVGEASWGAPADGASGVGGCDTAGAEAAGAVGSGDRARMLILFGGG